MLRLLLLLLTLALLAAGAPAQWKAEARMAPGSRSPAGKILEWTSAMGKPYLYRMPMKAGRGAPSLILMLHGTGMTYPWAFGNYQVVSSRFRPHDIIVAPEGMTKGRGETFNFVQGKADGDHIAGIIRSFKKSTEVGKVYLYGHSQGAFFCYWFAGEYPELVDGIVAHAGNVLDVKHTKLAKKKVAIGILHGRADAVVPVECALRTEKIYREAGYSKVKLEVVEGLTERTGHWPLPQQVREMLDWLDRVSLQSPDLLVDQVETELDKKIPDLAVIVEATRKARALAKRLKKDERAAVEERIARCEEMIDEVAAKHAEALVPKQAALRGAPAFEPWFAQFIVLEAALKDVKAWNTPLRKLRSFGKKHSRAVDKALAGLERSASRGLRPAMKAVEKSFLGARYPELLLAMERTLQNPPKGLGRDKARTFQQLVAERKEAFELGQKVTGGATTALLKGRATLRIPGSR